MTSSVKSAISPILTAILSLGSLLIFSACGPANRVKNATQDAKSVKENIESDFRKGYFNNIITYHRDNQKEFTNNSKSSVKKSILLVKSLNELHQYNSAMVVSIDELVLLHTSPPDSAAYFMSEIQIELSLAYLGIGRLEDAKKTLDSLHADMHTGWTLIQMAHVSRAFGLLAIQEGQFRKAQDFFENALEAIDTSMNMVWVDPICWDILSDLGNLMYKMDNIAKARAIQKRVGEYISFHAMKGNYRLLDLEFSLLRTALRQMQINRASSFDQYDIEKDDTYQFLVKETLILANYFQASSSPIDRLYSIHLGVVKMKMSLYSSNEYSQSLTRGVLRNALADNIAKKTQPIVDTLNGLLESLDESKWQDIPLLSEINDLKSMAFLNLSRKDSAVVAATKAYDLLRNSGSRDTLALISGLYNLTYVKALSKEIYTFDLQREKRRLDSLLSYNLLLCKNVVNSYINGSTPNDVLALVTSYIRYPLGLYIAFGAEADIEKEYTTVEFFKNIASRNNTYIHSLANNRNLPESRSINNELEELATRQTNTLYSIHNSATADYLWYYSMNYSKRWKKLSRICYGSSDANAKIPPSYSKLSGVLDSNEAVIDFIYVKFGDGVDNYIAYVLTKGNKPVKVILHQTPEGITVDEMVDMLRKQLEADSTKDDDNYRGLCNYLSDYMWYPILEAFPKKMNRLIIIPDNQLAGFPFSTLREGGQYLCEIYSICFANDLGNIINSKTRGESKSQLKFLLAGGIDYGIHSSFYPASYIDALPPLGSSLLEVQNIRNDTQGAAAISLKTDNVSESFIKDSIGSFDVVHLATHGFYIIVDSYDDLLERKLDNRHAFPPYVYLGEFDPYVESGLAFSFANSRNEKLTKNNGLLTALELSFLDLRKIRLVVLSSCNSALGASYTGEGFVNILKALQDAGVKDILATIFTIKDGPSSKFMSFFYNYAGNHVGSADFQIDKCLKLAVENMRNYRLSGDRVFSAPKYWVPFVVYIN